MIIFNNRAFYQTVCLFLLLMLLNVQGEHARNKCHFFFQISTLVLPPQPPLLEINLIFREDIPLTKGPFGHFSFFLFFCKYVFLWRETLKQTTFMSEPLL